VISIFRDKSIVAIFGLIVCGLLTHLHIFYVPVVIKATTNTGFFSWLIQTYLVPLRPLFVNAIYIILLLSQAVRLNMVLNNSKMYSRAAFTTAFAYILFSGLLINAYAITPALICISLIIWLLNNIFLLYNNPSANGLIFNIGFVGTISAMCYQPSVTLIVAILFALGILRAFKPAEWLILLLGVIAPVYLLLSGLFLFDKMNFVPLFLPKIQFVITLVKEPWYWFNLSVIFIFVLAGLISWFPNSNRMVIQTRKNWVLMLILSLLFLFGLFIFNSNNQFPEILFLVPIAAFVSNYFLYTRRSILANFLVLLAIGSIIHHHLVLFK
jgi:hypothetical protein